MDTNKEWLKKARAKRIARIQRRRGIDDYIRGRVYVIILGLIMTLGVVGLLMSQIEDKNEDMRVLQMNMSDILVKTKDTKLLKDNIALAHAIDSLQILIFAYNIRHQRDAAEQLALLYKGSPKRKIVIEVDTSSINLNNKNEKSLLDFEYASDSIDESTSVE